MYRITIIGRDLKEFQENLKAYAEVHLGSINGKATTKPTKTKIAEQLLSESEEEMEEVESPYKASPSLTVVEEEPTVDVKTTEEVLGHSGDLDSEGFPWDKRIHSSSKQTVADGTWRKRRNLDDAIYNSVKAELESKGYGKKTVTPQAPQAPVVAPTPVMVTPAPAPQAPVVPQVTVAPTPTPTPAPVAQPVVAPAPQAPALPQMMTGGHSLQTFSDNFPMVLAGLINEKKLTQEWVNSLCSHYGVTEIWTLNNEQKAQVFDLFVQHGLVTRVG